MPQINLYCMNFLSVEKLDKHIAELTLFSELNFGIEKGDKIALVAKNGAGKSTLLRVLAKIEEPDGGMVTYRSGIRMALLPQDPDFYEDQSVAELIKSHQSGLLEVTNEYAKALDIQSHKPGREAEEALAIASNKMDLHQAWDHERRLDILLQRFNISDQSQQVATLSGGQKKRLSLAMTLLDNPDILLLDEPTNHLDLEMIEWLEKYLSQSHITFIMVTHDRYFLDRVCNQIMELSYGTLYSYTGNYTSFLHQKAEREEIERTEIDKARKLMKKEQEWINRMPKARTHKSKSRIDSFEKTKEKAHSLKTDKELKLQVNHTRIGGKILEMKHVSKSYGDNLLIKDFSYLFKKGERIGIVGKNGVGKSTFLKLITEKIKADSGTISSGDTIVYGHYSQEGIQIKEDQRVIDVVKEIAEIIPQGKEGSLTASQLLQLFMFTSEMQNQVVALLSGGERRRLYLLTVLIKNPNFLILDEPTNDLDLMTLDKLEEFLVNYKGCLLLVSHDRYFLDHTIDHMFVFEGEGVIRDFPGNYSQYRASLDARENSRKLDLKEEKRKIEASVSQSPQVKKKLTYAERKEYEKLEIEIETLEKEKSDLIAFMDSGTHDYEKLTESSERISSLIQLIDEKMMRWLELEEMA